MPDTSQQYEIYLQRIIKAALKQVQAIYEDAILEIAVMAAGINPVDRPFSLSLYPQLQEVIEARIRNMHKSLLRLINASQKAAWQLSNQKNDLFVDKRLKGRKELPEKVRAIYYDPNEQALNAFTNRKKNGLNLSARVWKTLAPFKHEMEQAIGLHINEGVPAAKMATRLKAYLNEPDRLFRRVRGKDGKLRLSKAAREYHPGQGVYRSSYKNAARLTRTENNLAYRSSDHERWKKLDFVIGIEVKLSAAHPHFDICDSMVGRYPKDYKHTGFHPQCICYSIPILMSDEQYGKLEDYLLGLSDKKPAVPQVEDIPESAKKWIEDNRERMEGWKSKPYWLRDNKQYVNR